MAEPNPSRYTDDQYGLLPKVFIVYPHNPQLYQWPKKEDIQEKYPLETDEEIRRLLIEERKATKQREKRSINQQDELVHRFAQCLDSHKIAVAYEGLLMHSANIMRWFEEQMKDSDYIILVITKSFRHFLSNGAPETEHIFRGELLHVIIHNPNPKKPLLPVFLNIPEDRDLLPDPLRAASTYHIKMSSRDPPYFDVRSPQLDRLYAMFTKQNRIQPIQPQGVVTIPHPLLLGGGGGGGGGGSQQQPIVQTLSEIHQRMYSVLSAEKRPLKNTEILTLSQKPGFSTHWERLASSLHIPPAEMERIRVDYRDNNERCFKMFNWWKLVEEHRALVCVIAEGIYRFQNPTMLEIFYNVVMSM